MLKTLKWVYDLGVKQERVRIAAHLQAAAQGRRVTAGVMDDMLFDEALKELESIISEQVIGDNLPLPEEVLAQTGTRLYNKIKEEEREALKAVLYGEVER